MWLNSRRTSAPQLSNIRVEDVGGNISWVAADEAGVRTYGLGFRGLGFRVR